MKNNKKEISDLVYNGKFLKIKQMPYKNTNYEIVEMNNAVAAFIMDKSLTKVLLAKQYRPAYGDFTYEIPAGMLDVSGENEKDCMAREIIEEVNLTVNPENLEFLVNYMPMIGSATHRITIYSAIYEGECENIEIENDDVVERIWVDHLDLADMVKKGIIIDGKTLLAFYIMINKMSKK